jgi:hypothetical protein
MQFEPQADIAAYSITSSARSKIDCGTAPCMWRRPLYGTWEASSVSGSACRTGS